MRTDGRDAGRERNTSVRRDTSYEKTLSTGAGSSAVAEDNEDREQTLRALIGAHGLTVRAVLARSEVSRDDVDDLWADVFLLAFRRLDQLSELSDGQQRGWLIRSASYLAANNGRRRTSWRTMLDRLAREPLEQQTSPEEAVQEAAQRVEDANTSRAVELTLHRLRAADRQVLVLDALGRDGPSIGRQLGISAGAARKRLMVARIAFRQQFDAPGDEPAPAVAPAPERARTEP